MIPKAPFLLSLLIFITTLGGLRAADAPDPQTSGNPSIPTEHLALLLNPLTEAELAVDASAWQDLLKAKAQEISTAEIGVRSTPTAEEKSSLIMKISTLQTEKSALLERFNIVLDAYELKGGDPASFRKYGKAVGKLNADVTDVSTTWILFIDWLKSSEGGIKWGINILKFLGIMFAFWIVARIVTRIVNNFLDRTAYMSDLLEAFINKMVAAWSW